MQDTYRVLSLAVARCRQEKQDGENGICHARTHEPTHLHTHRSGRTALPCHAPVDVPMYYGTRPHTQPPVLQLDTEHGTQLSTRNVSVHGANKGNRSAGNIIG